ncbi:MAG: ABC transporter permease, partial [Nitrospinaceae bacterium]
MNATKDAQMMEGLKPTASLFEERWDIFKRNHLAYFSFIFLMVLFVFAIIGKILTRWIVLFDPKLVRLPEKFLPPLTP